MSNSGLGLKGISINYPFFRPVTSRFPGVVVPVCGGLMLHIVWPGDGFNPVLRPCAQSGEIAAGTRMTRVTKSPSCGEIQAGRPVIGRVIPFIERGRVAEV